MYHTRYQKVIRGHSESGQRSKMERFGKIIVDFNYLCKKKPTINLLAGTEYVPGFKYVRVLNIRKFS